MYEDGVSVKEREFLGKSFDFFYEEDPDEVQELISGKYFSVVDPLMFIKRLFENLVDESCDVSEFKVQLAGGYYLKGGTSIDYEGSGEYSSQESCTSAYLYDKNDDWTCEIYYSVGSAHCSDSQLLSFEVIPNEELLKDKETKDEESMAELSNRKVVKVNNDELSLSTKLNNITGVNNMTAKTTLRTVAITLLDNNTNLKLKQKIVFQNKAVLTEYSDQDTLQDLIATGEVKAALDKHNEEVRAKTIDKTIRNNTGRDVTLDPIELISELQWQIVQVA